jgi:hypothetical protein
MEGMPLNKFWFKPQFTMRLGLNKQDPYCGLFQPPDRREYSRNQ